MILAFRFVMILLLGFFSLPSCFSWGSFFSGCLLAGSAPLFSSFSFFCCSLNWSSRFAKPASCMHKGHEHMWFYVCMVPRLHVLTLNMFKGPFHPVTSSVCWKVPVPIAPPKHPASLGCPPGFLGNHANHEPFILTIKLICASIYIIFVW